MSKRIVSSVFLLLAFLGNGYSQPVINTLETGDLIFQNGECGPLCRAINEVTPSIYGVHFSHIGIITIEEEGVFMIEAIGDSVQKTELKTFLQRSQGDLMIGRLKETYRPLIPAAVTFAENQIGVPYDDDFIYDNGKYYCSELIHDAFKAANQNEAVFLLQPMTFKSPGSDTYFLGWLQYYERRGIPVPEGQPGCNPGGIGQSDKIDVYLYAK